MAKIKNETIDVIGADANNLRDIDISFPVGELSMVVGVSGSGKSSLLLNILARQGGKRLKSFLGVSQDHLAPPVGLAFVGRMPPTLHIGQRAFRASSRTTVGTSSSLLPCFGASSSNGPAPFPNIAVSPFCLLGLTAMPRGCCSISKARSISGQSPFHSPPATGWPWRSAYAPWAFPA